MTKFFTCLLLLVASSLWAQPSTEIYAMDIAAVESDFKVTELSISNFTNLSNDAGYDNQPSFLDDDLVLFAGTVNDNTEIVVNSVSGRGKMSFFKSTPGGEYSPQLIPNSDRVAAVRLDEDGRQRLYNYAPNKGVITEAIEGLQVAYFRYYDAETILASVLAGGNLDLVLIDLKTQTVDTLLEKSGRSIHTIPNKTDMSYTSVNEDGNFDIYQIDLKSKESFFVAQLPAGIQDHIWLDDSKLLCGSGSKLYLYDLFGDGEWKEVADLSTYQIKDISRLALNPSGNRLALVAESIYDSPSAIVKKHIPLFNKRDLDAFMDCFSEEVTMNTFPNKQRLKGQAAMRESYAEFYETVPQVSVEVNKEMVLGNFVVYEELETRGSKKSRHATIFDVAEDKISSMTFIHDFESKEDPEVIVQKQLDAYNNRDIDGFMATYSEDVKLYSFPNKLNNEGQEAMRSGYEGYFKITPDLHCEIKERIVIGNKVIDLEFITANGQNFSAIAIYEVKNGLIAKVTFIQ